jgi:anti-sigma regulatory factor (Ser/Thr protein kinase)
MWLRIIDIDPDASRVHLELAPDQSEECFSRLDSFISRCAEEGIVDIRLHYRRGTSKRNVMRLKDFAAMKRFQAPVPAPHRSGGRPPRPSPFALEHTSTVSSTGDPAVRYEIESAGTENAVELLHTTTALVCASENLDPRSTLLLRLFVYELTSNSVEHGMFATDAPAVRLCLEFSRDRVEVIYRDNAGEFLTTGAADGDLVGEQIRSNRKRGLGLYMLNKVCADLDYNRTDDWNVTSFSLGLNRGSETIIRR